MSKAEILEELPKLRPAERGELLDRLQELAEKDLLGGFDVPAEERALLDREWEEFEKNPEAGSSWSEVKGRLRGSGPKA